MIYRLFIIFMAVLLATMTIGCSKKSSGTAPTNPINPASTSTTGTVSVFITDSVSTDYRAVWVQLKQISTTSSTGTQVTLFSNTNGEVLNLKHLNSVGRLVAAKTLAPGSYTTFSVTLADQVKLIPNTGGEINAVFTGNGADKVIDITGSLEVQAEQVTGFAIDFDLLNFSYDSSTNVVTPSLVYKGPSDVLGLPTVYAKVEGTITALGINIVGGGGSNRFTLRQDDGGQTITVNLGTNTTIIRESGGALASVSDLAVGQEVDVNGGYNPIDISISADYVTIDDDSGNSGGGSAGLAEAEGDVVTIVTADELALSVDEADFYVTNGLLTVQGVSSATFINGNAGQLQVGQELDVSGNWDGTKLTARYIKIDDDDDGSPGSGVSPPPPTGWITTVEQVQNNPGLRGQLVVMQGQAVAQLNSEDWLFSDGTGIDSGTGQPPGSIKLEWERQPPLPLNQNIEIKGKVESDEVDVRSFRVLP